MKEIVLSKNPKKVIRIWRKAINNEKRKAKKKKDPITIKQTTLKEME